MKKGNSKILIRNLRKQAEKDKEVLSLSNVSNSVCQAWNCMGNANVNSKWCAYHEPTNDC